MTLKELQQMIKEEFAAYHEADDVDVSVSDADVDVDAGAEEMGDEFDSDAEETDEDILRNIYDMLKAKFEAEDELGDEEGIEDIEDVEGGEDEEADIEENATTKAKFQKQGYAAGGDTKGGTNSGMGNVGGKGSDGYPLSDL